MTTTESLAIAADAATETRYAAALAILTEANPTTARERYDLAKARAEYAQAEYDASEDSDGVETNAADDELAVARTALRDSTEPRAFALREGGEWYETIQASSVEAALSIARDNVDSGNYGDVDETIWVDVQVRCEETDEEGADTVTLQPDEPACTEDEHDWQQVRVRGNAGGVIVTERCAHCEHERVTNTWAQRRDTGEQGLTSVSYTDTEAE